MNKPYTITKKMWDRYHQVQKSGRINMMLHPLVEYFMSDDAWSKSFEHFENNNSKKDLVIE